MTVFEPPMLGRTLLILLILAGIILVPKSMLAQSTQPFAPAAPTISSYLSQQLATTNKPISFLIILRDQVDAAEFAAEQTVQAAAYASRGALLYHELTARAAASQAPLRAWLTSQGIPFRAHYLVNMIEVTGDQSLAIALTNRPEVDRLVANPLVANALSNTAAAERWRQQLTTIAADEAVATAALPYGLEFTHAPDVWAKGYTGKGILIASQDTGIEWDNPALQATYRGFVTTTMTNGLTTTLIASPATITASGGVTPTVEHRYNWFDAWGIEGRPSSCEQEAQVPCDDHGHGTHTVGTMVGDLTTKGGTILGMAPDAQWIGCRNMHNGFGTPSSYTACFEFFLAPYPQGGDPFTDGRPELAPNIINNSWGCPPSEGCDPTSLRQVVEAMRVAGQMVVASAGNDGGNGCYSIRNPIAVHDAVFSVGAHNSGGTIASFSSRGPVTADGSGRLKPDISAPGVGVISANLGGGTRSLSGTSMASPHVAGAVALLWSAVPALIGDIDRTEQILIKSATPMEATGCGEGDKPIVPNYSYGYGELNILAAVEMAQAPVGLTVAVVDEAKTPLADQLVTVTDSLTGYRYTATTVFNGLARLPYLYAGEYAVSVAGTAEVQTVKLVVNQPAQVTVALSAPTPTNFPIYLPILLK